MGQGDGPALAWLLPPRYGHGDGHLTRRGGVRTARHMGVCAHLQGRGCRLLRPGPTLSPRGRRPRPVARVPSFALKQGPVLLSPLCALRNLKSSAPILPRPACKHPGLPGRGERGFSARARQRAAAVYGSSHFRRTHGAERSVFRWERRVTQSRAPGGQRPRAGDGRVGEDRAGTAARSRTEPRSRAGSRTGPQAAAGSS